MSDIETHLPPLLISLKPIYADLIFEGLKTAELRRKISSGIENREVFIYVSSPIRELKGGFRVGQVWSGNPCEIWDMVSDMAGVSAEEFQTYYKKRKIAYAIEILDVWKFSHPLSLSQLRHKFPGFVAPQSYRFVRKEELRSFSRMKRVSFNDENESRFLKVV